MKRSPVFPRLFMSRPAWILLASLLGCHQDANAAGSPPPTSSAPAQRSPAPVKAPPRDRPRPDFGHGRVFVQTPGGEVALDVEVASNDPQRMHGLMFKESLLDTQGMLFVFQKSETHNFWMKNTVIPLDMLFVGEDRKVVGIFENATPLSLAPMGVGKPSLYVLEVNAGWSRNHGVTAGAQLRFEGVE